MTNRLRGRAAVLSALVCAALAACADDGPGARPYGVSVDTLADGSVVVTNPARGVWDRAPERRWRLAEAVRVGRRTGEGPDLFGQVGGIVEDALGRMWIVDSQANEVRVFDRAGGFVRTVGGSGEGPGEFKRIGPAFPGPDGRIWIEDVELARFEVFDTAGARVAGHRSASRLRGGWRHWTADGRLLAADVEAGPDGDDRPFVRIHRLDDRGVLEVVGTAEPPWRPEAEPSQTVVFEYPDGYRIEQRVPLAPVTALAHGRDGDWWLLCGTCGPGRYDLLRLGEDGDTLLTIRRAHEPVAASEEVRRAALAELERYSEGARVAPPLTLGLIPAEHPPFQGFMAASDGSLWLLAPTAGGGLGFDVFASDGRYLGQPEVPSSLEGLRFHAVTEGSVYAVAYDELGTNYVVRLDIEREPARNGGGVPTGQASRPAAVPAAPEPATEAARNAAGAGGGAEPSPPEGAFRDCEECPWMVEIPAGSFLMGSPESEEGRWESEGPRRRVDVAAFAAGVYEVTFDEWEACVEAGGCGYSPPSDIGPRGTTPVMWVKWEHAQEYAAWLSRATGERYRLLSEAEWEYAARAGSAAARFWGESSLDQCRYANGYDRVGHEVIGNLYREPVDCDDGHGDRAPVGSYPPNAFGLHDMLGNVLEWTQDCWNGSYEGGPLDGSAWESGNCDVRVLRGGDYLDESGWLRTGSRVALAPITNSGIGFRVARDLR